MQVDILNIQGAKTGRTIELPEEIFGAEPNNHVIYLAVKQYLAAQRQGTHKVKTRAEANGSSKKLVKQKGTGGARKGNLRSPIYKGGGTIFGPKPHLYDFKLNRKVCTLNLTLLFLFNIFKLICRLKFYLIHEEFQSEKPVAAWNCHCCFFNCCCYFLQTSP